MSGKPGQTSKASNLTSALLFLLCLMGWHSAPGQLTINPDPPIEPNVHFFLSVPELQTAPHPPDDPFYWSFWVFGNGEYYPPLYRRLAPDLEEVKFCWENYETKYDPNSEIQQSHEYFYASPGAERFVPIGVPLPRKGDPPIPPDPPDLPAFLPAALPEIGGISIATPGTTSHFRTILPGKRISLAHSHGYLNYRESGGERSVFVISYDPPACITDTGKVYLLIGASRNDLQDQDPERSDHLWFSEHIPPEHYNPAYYEGQNNDVSRDVSETVDMPFYRQFLFSFFNDYPGKVRAAVQPSMPSSIPIEFRLFQEVQFENPSPAPELSAQPNLGTDAWSYALAILTSTRPCRIANTAILDYLNHIPGIETVNSSEGLYTFNGEYIIDADTIYLKNGEPHDPNRLYVTSYCDNLLTATLRLDFCNLPPATGSASGAEIRFRIIDPNFQWCRLSGLQDQNGNSLEWATCNLLCFPIGAADNHYHCASHCIDMNDLNLSIRECASVNVVIRANAATISPPGSDVQYPFLDYLKHFPVLEATVVFHGTDETITRRNELLDSTSYWAVKTGTHDCADCEGYCFPFWFWLIPAILVFTLIGLALRRRNIRNRRNQI